jgi:uncharacterized protein YndB with AHSA1/START domain
MRTVDPDAFEHALTVGAPPAEVLAAFFDPDLLRHWWQVERSVTTPRTLGVYALSWAPTDVEDDLLGRLGGTFYGTVIDYRVGREFFLADAYWLPPDGDPIGPMALHVTCEAVPGGTRLTLRQSGCDDSPRWRRFYGVIANGWRESLELLREYLEGDERLPSDRGPSTGYR